MKRMKKALLAICAAAFAGALGFTALEAPTPAEAETGPDSGVTSVSAEENSASALAWADASVTSIDYGTLTYGTAQEVSADVTFSLSESCTEAITFNKTGAPRYGLEGYPERVELSPSHRSATYTIKFAYNGSNPGVGSYTDYVQYMCTDRGVRNIEVKFKVQSGDAIKIASIDEVVKQWGETVSPNNVTVRDDSGNKYTLADFGLTSNGLGPNVNVSTSTYAVKESGATGNLSFEGSVSDLPQLKVTVTKQAPSLADSAQAEREIESGQPISAAGIKVTVRDRFTRQPIEGTAKWDQENTAPKVTGFASTNRYPYTFRPTDQDHYEDVHGYAYITINPQKHAQSDPGITITAPNVTYDGETHPAKVSLRYGNGAVSITYNGLKDKPKDAGTYLVRVEVAEDTSASVAAGSKETTFTISQKEATFSVPQAQKFYGQEFPFSSSYQVVSGVVDGKAVYAQNINSEGAKSDADVSSGGYAIDATSSDSNYKVVCLNRLVVKPATPSLKNLSAGSASTDMKLRDLTITGDATNPFTGATIEGDFEWISPDTQVQSGQHSYSAKFVPKGADQSRYVEASVNVSINGSTKPVVNLTVDQQSTNQVYDGSEKKITARSETSGATVKIEYQVNGSWSTTGPTNAGSYSYRVTASSSDPNLAENRHEGTLIIEKAPVTGGVTVTGSGTTLAGYTLHGDFVGIGQTVHGSLDWVDSRSTEVKEGVAYAWKFTPSNQNFKEFTGEHVVKPKSDAEHVDYTKLGKLAEEAQALRKQTTISADGSDVPTNKQWVTQEVENTLLAAIEHANNHLSSATQQQVDHAYDELLKAINSYKASMSWGTQKSSGGGGGGGGTTVPPTPQKKQSTIKLSESTISVRPGEDPKIVTVSGEGDGQIFAIGDNDKIAFVDMRGSTLHVTGLRQGTCEVRVVRSATENYAEASAVLVVNVGEPLPGFDPDAVNPEPEIDGRSTYRLYNPFSGAHLFTKDPNEVEGLRALGWTFEGSHAMPDHSSTPVYRLYNPWSYDHHYTTNPDEYATCVENGWSGEGIIFYSDDDKAVPVYRLFNPYVTEGTHHYTEDEDEFKTLLAAGWEDEGIGWHYMS